MTLFEDAKIISKRRHALIVKVIRNDEEKIGFLPLSNASERVNSFYKEEKPFTEKIKIRFIDEKPELVGYPVCTQRVQNDIGECHDFIVDSDDEKVINVLDENGCKCLIRKAPWEQGPAYKKLLKGSKILCRVNAIENGKPILTRKESCNPYFKKINEILSNKEIIEETFNTWCNDKSSDELKIKLFKDYINGNANWLFSYLNLLKIFLHDNFSRFNYSKTIQTIDSMIEILNWLQNSGFLVTQNLPKRNTTKKSITKQKTSLKRLRDVADSLNKGDYDSLLDTIITTITKSEISTELENAVEKSAELMRYSSLKILPEEKLEKIVLELSKRKLLFEYPEPYFDFRIQIGKRRKAFRKILFTSSGLVKHKALSGNSMLKHYIFLKEIERDFCINNGDPQKAAIEKGAIFYHRALFSLDKNEKVTFAKKTIKYLETLRSDDFKFDLKSNFHIWEKERNLYLARANELLSNLSEDSRERIVYLSKTKQFYIYASSPRSYLVNYFIEYFKILELMKKEDIGVVIKEIAVRYEQTKQDLKYEDISPQIRVFNDIYKIILLMGDTSEFATNTLMNLYQIQGFNASQKGDLPDVSKLASIVLANNILIPLLNDSYHFFELAKDFMLKGNILIPLDNELGYDEGDLKSDHKIFNEEVTTLELKGSYSIDINRFISTNKLVETEEIKDILFKAIVGMLNRDGGIIFVGVLETDRFKENDQIAKLKRLGAVIHNNRIILGIEPELKLLNINCDNHIQRILDKMRNKIDNDVGTYVSIVPEKLKKRTLYRIEVKKYPFDTFGAYLNEIPYVRENNQTIPKNPKEFNRYWFSKNKNL